MNDDFNDDDEFYGYYPEDADEDDALPAELQQAIDRLRETLNYDMANAAYRNRYGEDPNLEELEEFIEEMISERVNGGHEDWDDFTEVDWE